MDTYQTDKQRSKMFLVFCLVMLLGSALSQGFTGVMITLWLALLMIFSLSWLSKKEGGVRSGPLSRYLVAEGARNGLTQNQVYTRVQVVCGVLILIIPALWFWAK